MVVLGVAAAIALPAQTLTTLATFNGANGASPLGALVQGLDGNFYGTTAGGGASIEIGSNWCASGLSGNQPGCGTIFKITPSGLLTTLYSFCTEGGVCSDGMNPQAGLVLGTDGNFYGTTAGGGAYGAGSIFKITAAGKLTTVYSFCAGENCPDGASPWAGLVQATNGDFYGTTAGGGASAVYTSCPPIPITNGKAGCGTVFKVTPKGTLTTLYSFCTEANCSDGAYPQATLIQATNGAFYGATVGYGAFASTSSCASVPPVTGCGTIFKITQRGTLTTMHSFDYTDGSDPQGLVQATNGHFYGTTAIGGDVPINGTIFRITPAGALTTLQNLNGGDGGVPNSLVQATDGNFYGTTQSGGPAVCGPNGNGGCGVIFDSTPSGTLTVLYGFENTTGGYYPHAALVQGTDGSFYGTTAGAPGSISSGTVFNLSVGLGPFVEALPASGKVGAAVKILGTNLTGASKVTFHGTAAAFTVVSASEITTTVPTGATTGTVEVVTPTGTLKSNMKFRVRS